MKFMTLDESIAFEAEARAAGVQLRDATNEELELICGLLAGDDVESVRKYYPLAYDYNDLTVIVGFTTERFFMDKARRNVYYYDLDD